MTIQISIPLPLECIHFNDNWWWWRWFNEQTVQTLSLVPSPTGPHPARGDSGVCMCIHVCLVWSVFPKAFICHITCQCADSYTLTAKLDSIWTWRNGEMHTWSRKVTPTGDRTRAASLAVQYSTYWATPSSRIIGSKWLIFYGSVSVPEKHLFIFNLHILKYKFHNLKVLSKFLTITD